MPASRMLQNVCTCGIFVTSQLPPLAAQSLPLAELRALGPVAAHPCDADYYQPVIYANAIFPGADAGTWNEFDEGSIAFGGVAVPTFGEARFDPHGYPKTLGSENLGPRMFDQLFRLQP